MGFSSLVARLVSVLGLLGVMSVAGTITSSVVLCDSNNTHCATLASQPGTLNYNDTVFNGSNSITLSGFAGGDVDTLTLKASATSTVQGPQAFYTQYQAFSQITDTWVIDSPGLAGAIGHLSVLFDVTGTTTPAALGTAVAFAFDDGSHTTSCPLNNCFFSGNAVLVGAPLEFHYGKPFTINWALGAVTFPQTSVNGPVTVTADYSHTARLAGIALEDASGNPVYSASIIGSSGAVDVNILTPEPVSMALTGFGLCLLTAARRRRRRS
jgi:hypothetical protein